MDSPPHSPVNVIPFPTRSIHTRSPNLSMVSTRTTALDVCFSVYGESPASTEAVDNYYEPNASIYENPFITATSRSVIGDIHRLSRQLSSVDVPRPLAMLCTLFHLTPPQSNDPLFQGLRVWTDILDICENESFDGHRKVIVEHTLNILLLPGIHCEGTISHRAGASTDSLFYTHASPGYPSQPHKHPFISPSLPIPGTSLSLPSPLHSKLRIITRLSFNEQGLVTQHRDIWDIKDVMGLVPGVSLAQWIGTRITAVGLSYISKLLPNNKHEGNSEDSAAQSLEVLDLEHGR